MRAVQSDIRGAKVSEDFESGTISRINVYPIKSFPGVTVASSDVLGSGALKWDRRLALVEPNGEFVNLKRVPELHEIRADFQTLRRDDKMRFSQRLFTSGSEAFLQLRREFVSIEWPHPPNHEFHVALMFLFQQFKG